MSATLDNLIATEPGLRGGQPCIAGTRLAVSDIAILYTRFGLTAEEIGGKHGVEPGAVHAALAYYYAHRDAIEARIADDTRYADDLRRSNKSVLPQPT